MARDVIGKGKERMWRMAALSLAFLVAATFPVGAQTMMAGSEGETCGKGVRTGAVAMCGRGLFCEPALGSCSTDKSPGRCARVPQVCTMLYRPVCGCDGKTYGNDCDRRAQRVGKKHEGQC